MKQKDFESLKEVVQPFNLFAPQATPSSRKRSTRETSKSKDPFYSSELLNSFEQFENTEGTARTPSLSPAPLSPTLSRASIQVKNEGKLVVGVAGGVDLGRILFYFVTCHFALFVLGLW